MTQHHFFDDPEQGLARETSHPRFCKLAADDFYYDCTDDFSPFGNDDGADTLAYLEDWYREGGRDDALTGFLQDLIDGWDFGVPPELVKADSASIEKWLTKGDMHENFLQSVCNACVATAFGQLKITGAVRPEIRGKAMAAIDCQIRLNDIARKATPNWPHADENLARLRQMREVLAAV